MLRKNRFKIIELSVEQRKLCNHYILYSALYFLLINIPSQLTSFDTAIKSHVSKTVSNIAVPFTPRLENVLYIQNVCTQISLFWVVAPFSLVEVYQRFRR
jgi:hypothetical protein